MRRILALTGVTSLLALSLAAATTASAAGDCQYVLGFKEIHDAMPGVIGACLTNEFHDGQTGDGLQRTTRGLLVWRKADNSVAFTDGYHTWVDGPHGMQSRLNDQRFAWEHDADLHHPDHLGLGVPQPRPPSGATPPPNYGHDADHGPGHDGERGVHH